MFASTSADDCERLQLGDTSGALTVADAATVRRKPPSNLQAYDYYALGQDFHYRMIETDVTKAEELLKKAIELDPQFARAYFSLGHLYNTQASFGWGHEDPVALFERAKTTLLQATTLDSTDAIAYAVLGVVYVSLSNIDRGFVELERAYALNPNDPDVLVHYGGMLPIIGRAQEGVEMINRAHRLNPRYPVWYDAWLDPFYATGQYDQVTTRVRRTTGDVAVGNQLLLAMSYAQLSQQTDTATAVAKLLGGYPDFSLVPGIMDS
jgi:Tfp pilus assembly protein PilF